MTKAVSSGAKLLIVIIIIATVGVCISCRAGFSGTATYSGTWSGWVGAPGLRHDVSGTCELTFDFDAGTVSISFAGDLTGTATGTIFRTVYGDIQIGKEKRLTAVTGRINGYRCDVYGSVPGTISRKNPNEASGKWILTRRETLEAGTGLWKAQKVSNP